MNLNTFTFSDPVTMHDAMCERLMYGDRPDEDYDWSHGTEVGLHNVTIGCDTVDFNYDLKKLWIPPTRWTMMARQYVDPGALADCLDKIEERFGSGRNGSQSRGIAVMRTRLVQGKGTGRGVRRRWGSCMLSLSFRKHPIPTVTLTSRTTYFGYLALVDVAVARSFAVLAAERCGVKIQDVQFVWRLDLAQFHGFRSLAWALGNDEIRTQMDEDVDNRMSFSSRRGPGNQVGYRKALDGYARILKSDRAGTLYGDESFSSFARVRRRFHTEVFGPEYSGRFVGGTRHRSGKGEFPVLPHTWVRKLGLTEPLANRPQDSAWFDRDDDADGFDDDEDE